MTAFARLVEHRFLVIAGWTLLLVVWESAALAVILEGWRTLRPGAPARRQYACAGAALALTLLFAASTPFVLARVPSSAAVVVTSPEAPSAVPGPSEVVPANASSPAPYAIAHVPVNTIAGAAGLLWIAGATLLALKLFGGWLLAWRVHARAIPLTSPAARASVARLRSELDISLPIELLESPEVEAPVVLGWRRPALILPHDIAVQLSPDMVEPLLVHEFAHIKRHDYVVNLLQAIVDLLLFFSPAAVWISKRIREAREYCCDDFAVVTCGDPKRYVKALATLAALGALHCAKPSLGVAGPRLIVRVRRLLQEESMSRYSRIRIASLVIALLILTITGAKLRVVSAAHAASAARPASAESQGSIPYGYASEQPGSAAELTRVVSTPENPAELVSIRNKSNQPISGISLVAVVEFFPRSAVQIFTSELLPVSIAPGKTIDVVSNVLTAEQLQALAAQRAGRMQLFFGLAKIRYANGSEWSMTPNPWAASGADALNLGRPELRLPGLPAVSVSTPRPDLPRTMVAAPGAQPAVNRSVCYDDQSKSYSLGAVVGIRGEPGRFARCMNGQWVDGWR